MTSKKDIVLGEHVDVVKSLISYNPKGLIISGSWDKTIKGWAINSPTYVFSTTVSDKVYAMAAADHFLAIGTADKNVSVFDVRKIDQPFAIRPTGFEYHIRSLAWLQNNEGYAVASSEGKVAVEYVTSSKKAFSFKCHKVVKKSTTEGEPPVTYVYPINCLGVHPKYGSLGTGGSDGSLCIWDVESRKKLTKWQVESS